MPIPSPGDHIEVCYRTLTLAGTINEVWHPATVTRVEGDLVYARVTGLEEAHGSDTWRWPQG